MDTRELLEKISVLPVIAGALSDDLLAGSFGSVFKGQGMEFDEVRHYQPGDDIRSIDWNASARFGNPFVKMYREERDLTILLLIDVSDSMRHAGWMAGAGVSANAGVSPYEQGLLAAALLAFSSERTGQRVGAILFDRGIEQIFPPRKGRRHIMSLLSGALRYHEKNARQAGGNNAAQQSADGANKSDIKAAINGAGRLLKRRGLVAVISDYFSVGWEEDMARLCRAHDVFALRISSPVDAALPRYGLAAMEDPETGVKISAPLGFASFRDAWTQWHADRGEAWAGMCKRSGAAYLELPAAADAPAALFRFFGAGRGKQPPRNRTGNRGRYARELSAP